MSEDTDQVRWPSRSLAPLDARGDSCHRPATVYEGQIPNGPLFQLSREWPSHMIDDMPSGGVSINWTLSNPAFALVDSFVVVVAYSLSLGMRTLDPMLANPSVLWAFLAVAMPFIIAIHLLANVRAAAYGSRIGQTTPVLVAGFLSGVLLLVVTYLARTLGVVIPFTVIAIGAGLTLVGMSLPRLALRSRQRSGPSSG